MKNFKCASCGLVNFATAINCKRCDQPLHIDYSSRDYSQATFGIKSKAESDGDRKGGMSTKEQLKFAIPVLFVLGIFIVSKDRMTNPNPVPGGYADLLQLSIIGFCMLGLMIYSAVLFLTRKR